MDTAHAEAVESGLDVLIEKRDRERRRDEGERQAQEMYMQSVRRYQERQHQQRLWDRLRFHEHMMRAHTRTYEVIIGRHRLEVERCEAMLGIAPLEKGNSSESGADAA